MSVLWIIVFLLLLCSIVWILLDPNHEGFQAEPTTWDALRNFFHYQVGPVENPQGIPMYMSPGVAQLLPQVDSAIETPGFPTKPQSLFRRLFDSRDPLITEDEKCRALPHPRLLPGNRATRAAKQTAAGEGCGWWYVPDPNIPSVGAYGNGPAEISGKPAQAMNVAGLPKGGRWVWDIDEANRLEDIKRCKTITTCTLLSATDRCGFCPSKGYSVPVTETGAVKYTTDDEGNCGDAGNLVTVAANCPKIIVPPQDYAGDFDYDINGNPIRNQRYRDLTNPQGIVVRDPCELKNGQITKLCRLTLCKELARCKEDKGLHRIISADGNLTDTDKVALFYLQKDAGLTLPETLWLSDTAKSTSKPLSKADASDIMERLYTTASSGPPTRGRAAALWFLNETPFNLCDFQDDDLDAFPLQCIQREFRKVGCQASGSRYPQTVGAFSGMTYGQIRQQFRDLFDQMQDDKVVKNIREQDEAVQKCLGITMERASDEIYEANPNMCREQGVEYWFTTIPTQNQRILYGRRVIQDSATLITDTMPFGKEFKTLLNAKTGTRGYTTRTYADISGISVTLTLRVPATMANFYGLWINQQQVLAETGSPGVYVVRLPMYQRSEIEVRYEGSGAELTLGTPQLTTIPNTPLYLAQSWWKPFLSLRASKLGFMDENRFLQLDSVPVVNKAEGDTRWGTPIQGLSLKSTATRGMWYSMVRTVTLMIYWSALSDSAVLWTLDQGNGGLRDTVMKLQVIGSRMVFTVKSGTSIFEIRSSATVGVANRWMHVGVVVGTPLSATVLYLDGKDVTVTGSTPLATGTLNPQTTAFQRVVLGGAGVEGKVGWFHVYERALGSADMGRDLAYDDPLYSDKDVSIRARLTR